MKKAIALILVTAFVLAFAPRGAAAAELTAETPAGNFGNLYVYYPTGQVVNDPALIPSIVPVVVYDNTTSPAVSGVSSTDLNATWGDRLATTGKGVVEEQAITIFNSASSNVNPILTANVTVQYFDGGSLANLGGFNGNVNFGAGLSPGFFSIVTFTGLSGLAINLNTQDVIITQKVNSSTGGSLRMGIASLDPVTVGSSPPSMYVQASTIGGGVAGFYTFTGINANPGYRTAIFPDPTPSEQDSWGSIKALYRQ